jgi:hypothetical protein
MQLISRQEAKAQGLLHYYTGKPCLRGHLSERLVSTKACCACKTEREQTPEYKAAKAAYAKKPEAKAARAAYAKANPEKEAARQAAHYKKNADKIAARAAAHYKKNADKIAAKQAAYRAANPHLRAAKTAQRRAAKLKATPAWANRQAIKKIYDDCAFVSRVTGEKHHVDHTYPLQSDWVCGLHVPFNLQILTAKENLTKSNKLLEQFA